MKKAIRTKFLVMLGLCIALLGGSWTYTFEEIPDVYYASSEEECVEIRSFYPVTTALSPVSESSYEIDVKYLGILPVKTVQVHIVPPERVVVGGESFGVRLFTNGVLVIGTADVGGSPSPGYAGGIRTGDILTEINGTRLSSNEDVTRLVEESNGAPLTFSLKRGGESLSVRVTPQKEDGIFKVGLWIRDSIAGIGTITYFDTDNGVFAALGHSINDTETGIILPILTGDAFGASIAGVRKGVKGTPGELKGMFLENEKIGTLYKNVGEGVFGILDKNYKISGQSVPIAYKQAVHTGAAKILCTVDGTEIREFDIHIDRVTLNARQTTKNMVIRVTDPELLSLTGGIVQGMSGSPILQDGKLIGAVTHVLISTPDTGYGIFIENMIDRESTDH